jgi:serine/threonine protein kinase
MGAVYLAEDNRLAGTRRAIKEMNLAQIPPQDRGWTEAAFRQEAGMLSQLSHPGLTRVTDFFAEGGSLYLVMDYVPGQTLEQVLNNAPGGRLSLEQALDIVRQLCDVLAYLHEQSPPVIFRDLKPANVMLTPQNQVRLIDFGIARFFKAAQTHDTVNLGTPGYAAPEQWGSQGQSDARSDIYGLGVLLLQLVTGYDPVPQPFPLPRPSQVLPTIPPEIEAIILCATQIRPDDRYQSVIEFLQALDAFGTTLPTKKGSGLWVALGAAGALFTLACAAWLLSGVLTGVRSGPETITAVSTSPGDGIPHAEVTPTFSPRPSPVPATLDRPADTPTPLPPIPQSPTNTPIPIIRTDTVTPIPFDPNGKLGFMSMMNDGNYEVYQLDLAANQLVRITNSPRTDGWASWSPDGEKIALSSNRDGNWEIYVMNKDGSEPVNITNDPAEDWIPMWSSSDDQLLFFSNRTGNYDVFIMDSDGTNVRQLTEHSADDWAPSFSPDKRKIVFMSKREGNWDIFLMDADGSNIVRLTDDPGEDYAPDFSPDGKRIAFSAMRDGDRDIYIMDSDGSNQYPITDNDAEDLDPSWSPDGRFIAFHSDLDGEKDIYVIAADGSNLRNVTQNDMDEQYPSWLPR